MRFNLVDRITAVEPGRVIQVVKNLSLGEEYLADHFPGFPVMPGVLMLQTLAEAGAWLLRITDDFSYSVIVLHEAKNVKYGNFMEPGKQMSVTVELEARDGQLATFRGKGTMNGNQTVSARLTLLGYNLRDRDPTLAPVDEQIINHLRRTYRVIRGEGLREAAALPHASR